MRGKEQIFVGYLPILTMKSTANTDCSKTEKLWQQIKNDTVKKFSAIPEIRSREWKNRGLMSPIEPDKLPEYRFSDMQMNLYYTFYL
jgi:hypothetical protein